MIMAVKITYTVVTTMTPKSVMLEMKKLKRSMKRWLIMITPSMHIRLVANYTMMNLKDRELYILLEVAIAMRDLNLNILQRIPRKFYSL